MLNFTVIICSVAVLYSITSLIYINTRERKMYKSMIESNEKLIQHLSKQQEERLMAIHHGLAAILQALTKNQNDRPGV